MAARVPEDGLDQLVTTVPDRDATCHFNETVRGMTQQRYGVNRRAQHFSNQKLTLHPAEAIPAPNLQHTTPVRPTYVS